MKPPDHVQIQTITGCNANCSFCPSGKTQRNIKVGRQMADRLYRSVIDQCLDLNIRRYSLYLMNEPLTDKTLHNRIAYISKRKQQDQYSKIITNGSLLTRNTAEKLLDSGLDKIKISIPSLYDSHYMDLMQLPLNKTMYNIDQFMKLKEFGGYKNCRLEIITIDCAQNHNEIPFMRNYWKSRGIKYCVEPVENRANHKSIVSTAIGSHELCSFSWCNRMMTQIYVLHDGRMLQCCADWEQKSVVGDLKKDTLETVWSGEKYKKLRKYFIRGNIRNMICNNCQTLNAIELN